jgi:hypothetical protein
MMSLLKRFGGSLLSSILLLSLLSTPPAANALSPFLQREATQWAHVYAAAGNAKAQSAGAPVAKLDAKSKFIVNYRNFPKWAERDFQIAVEIWSHHFASSVPITIEASWSRSSSSEILGSARPGSFFSDFDKSPDPSLWYPSALANAIAGKDLDTTESEMIIQVNSLADWNTTNDGLSYPNKYDLKSVFLHEMGHGLGFLSAASYDSFLGFGYIDEPTPFDAYVQVEDGRRLSDLPSPSLELGEAITGRLFWSGALGVAANNGVKPLLYTPSEFDEGSSVSHLDEATFADSTLEAMMTPSLSAGEIFREPGPLMLAMMEDMRRKPPAGVAVGLPSEVRNPKALVGDGSAIITFDPSANARTAQISSYTVRNLRTNQVKSASTSPIIFTGLKNGNSYPFSIIASNSNGSSIPVVTNNVTPQASWRITNADGKSSGKEVVSTSFNGKPLLAYIDAVSGDLKIGMWNGRIWITKTVDGAGGSAGKTSLPITGALSVCVNGSGTTQVLHIFYADGTDKDLRYAKFDGKSFSYDLVDGNGSVINDYEDPIRIRTASDVSVSSACVASASGIQVFYRDESQGILLGAVKSNMSKTWNYELVDGDRKTDGRTTGDVAFHLDAIFDGKTSYVLYDSVLTLNQKKERTSGEVRLATRTSFSATGWVYKTLEPATASTPMSGFDIALGKSAKGITAAWMSASSSTLPLADNVRWQLVSKPSPVATATTYGYGKPSARISTDGSMIAFNCEGRLCSIDISKATPKVGFVLASEDPDEISSTWVVVNRVKYLVAGINGQLAMLRP